MNVAVIIERVHREGLQIRTDGEKVILGPKEKVTPELVDVIRQNKVALIKALSASVIADDPTTTATNDAEREARRTKVAAMLQADPAIGYAYDVENTSPVGPAERPVSVLVGLRTADGQIVTGEFLVPAERWDMGVFVRYWDEQATGRPS